MMNQSLKVHPVMQRVSVSSLNLYVADSFHYYIATECKPNTNI